MPCSIKAWYDVTPEAGSCISRGHVNHLSNSNIQYMKIQTKCSVLLFALVSAALGLVGCGGYYSAYPGYGPYYGGAMVAVRIITDLITGVIRVPSLWRWAIGLTTATGRAIM